MASTSKNKPKPSQRVESTASKSDTRTVQLATRIDAKLHMAIKLHVIQSGDTIMGFVQRACAAELQRARTAAS